MNIRSFVLNPFKNGLNIRDLTCWRYGMRGVAIVSDDNKTPANFPTDVSRLSGFIIFVYMYIIYHSRQSQKLYQTMSKSFFLFYYFRNRPTYFQTSDSCASISGISPKKKQQKIKIQTQCYISDDNNNIILLFWHQIHHVSITVRFKSYWGKII